jgi:hypothetical protein
VDFDWNARPAGTAWDIGADEDVAPAAPRLLLPANGQQNVTTSPPPSGTNGSWIRWYADAGALRYDVYLGTSPTPPKVATLVPNGSSCSPVACTSVTYPGTLYFARPTTPNTTFYWRIVVVTPTATITGPVWSFRTAP